LAKIAGLEMCRAYRVQYGCNFIAAMPTNLFGPNDNFNLADSHVLPALLYKCHQAKIEGKDKMSVWGSGKPFREFLYSEDLGDACSFLLENYSEEGIINVGTGKEISIRELALTIKEVVGFEGDLVFDASKPDGTPRKLMDVSRLHELGWQSQTSLKEGMRKTYAWFLENYDHIRQ
ncbi:MAG: NAD-dependent epimerase/dehydratase family protein, partial [Planctomycetes bacterium]|nr:NAD-dependent epimerase/dehydratase family protein [Planctomycetota bacterium]